MKRTLNTIIYDNAVRHQIGILRYSLGEAIRSIGIFNKRTSDLFAAMMGHDPLDGAAINKGRLDNMLGNVEAIVNAIGRDINSQIERSVIDLLEHEVEYTVEVLDKMIPVPTAIGVKAKAPKKAPKVPKRLNFGFAIGAPSSDQVRNSLDAKPFEGAFLSEHYVNLPKGIFDKVKSTITQGYANGQTTEEIVRALRGTRASKYTDGVLQQSRRSIERTVRTALNHTANVAREQVYKKNDDLISGVRWVSTLDARTSEICMGLDGQVFPVDEGPRPPAHYNCRSCTTPIIKSWRELGFDIDELPEATRASMDGQVPAAETYGTWLGRQSEATQDDILGPTRSALFREGGLTLDRFTDDSGNLINIDQLRTREAAAFDRADL